MILRYQSINRNRSKQREREGERERDRGRRETESERQREAGKDGTFACIAGSACACVRVRVCAVRMHHYVVFHCTFERPEESSVRGCAGVGEEEAGRLAMGCFCWVGADRGRGGACRCGESGLRDLSLMMTDALYERCISHSGVIAHHVAASWICL